MEGNIDFNVLIQEMGKCCLTENVCETCDKEKCLVGYCKQSLLTTFKQQDEFIDGGMDDIPYDDLKAFDEETLINAIVFTLNQCKNCHLYHDEDCIINIIRSAMEIALIGQEQDYKGSTLVYFTDLQSTNKVIADKIYTAFKEIQGKKEN
ncbi:conserved hypothetical protein [Alkaliphilus metalliredigens QYMF]|uniref:Uncharacterized protein n=1 Tax=Alkaliphilus metalliredigens (strain QYMF) TaxID=293826 RepID=A6TLA6_ALKMQ|nr:hypothetical protein [Alkaliphilus metalliredigens]ABR46974.1 conserved hypothetical protein [Alkaliphilus metalliredigens QYMF]